MDHYFRKGAASVVALAALTGVLFWVGLGLWAAQDAVLQLAASQVETRRSSVLADTSGVQLAPGARSTVRALYTAAAGQEIVACLFGEGQRVEHVGLPNITESGRSSVRYQGDRCEARADFLGYIHNHPSGVCRPSKRDLASFFLDKEAEVLMVACWQGGRLRAAARVK